jgi:thiol peroxidase
MILLGLAAGALAPAASQPGKDDSMKTEQMARVTMRGKWVMLAGPLAATGMLAPDCRVVDANFQPVRLASFKGRVILLSTVPSLDTGICSLQTKRFNAEAAGLPGDLVILTVSEDLPFAQKRFCEAEKIDRIKVLSDCAWRELGEKFGLLIEDMGLLARSLWVIDRQGLITYRQLVPEIATEPDYEAALKAVRETLAKP